MNNNVPWSADQRRLKIRIGTASEMKVSSASSANSIESSSKELIVPKTAQRMTSVMLGAPGGSTSRQQLLEYIAHVVAKNLWNRMELFPRFSIGAQTIDRIRNPHSFRQGSLLFPPMPARLCVVRPSTSVKLTPSDGELINDLRGSSLSERELPCPTTWMVCFQPRAGSVN